MDYPRDDLLRVACLFCIGKAIQGCFVKFGYFDTTIICKVHLGLSLARLIAGEVRNVSAYLYR